MTHAVITVPAYFSQVQKADTRRAGLKAGLNVIKILDEPTAAAVAYGIDQAEDGNPKTILVYDLGGGTFDISVLMMSGGTFLTLNTEGDMWLGGDNFDQAIVEFAVKQIKDEYGIDPSDNERFMVTLKKEAQQAKERLGAMDMTELIITGVLTDDAGLGMDVFVEITRAEYEQLIRPLVQRSLKLVDQAIENANLEDDEVDFVLLAGNATMTPLVQAMLEQRFSSERVLRKKHPKHCVAEGAAVVAKLLVGTICHACGHANPEGATECENPDCGETLKLEGIECPECGYVNEPGAEVCAGCSKELPKIVVSGIATRSYGVQIAGDKLAVYVCKNDELPMAEPAWQMFYTQVPNQRMISLPVFGGDNLENASTNEKQGEAFAILPPMLPKGAGVRVGLQLDADEVFEVFARLENGTDLNPWLLGGGQDARVIEQLNELEVQMAANGVPPAALDAAREAVFENLAQGDYGRAQGAVDELGRLVEEHGAGDGDVEPLDERATRLVGFTRFVLDEYKWALPTEKGYELTRLLGATESALSTGDQRALSTAVAALDKATDELPDLIHALLGMRGAIMSRIHPVKPEVAAELLAELEQVIETLQTSPPRGVISLQMLMAKVVKVLESSDQSVACPSCGTAVQTSVRYCPKCKADLWSLAGEQVVTSGKGR